MKIKLGVNIDHAATLRQVRGGTTSYPDMKEIVHLSLLGGADQITIHLREDRRHIQVQDLKEISSLCKKLKVPLNLEMAANWKMVRLARQYKPEWCCFVPEKREELTTEGGLDVRRSFEKIKKMVEKLQFIGIECSMFIEPDLDQVRSCFEVGADAVELHTGHWIQYKGVRKKKEWQRLVAAASLAHELNMNVHAGHGLDYRSAREITRLPYLKEVNIGHALICYSLFEGLKKSVQKMKKNLRKN